MSAQPSPLLLVLAGPAGVGKSTLCDRLVAEDRGFERVVTATTRPPRPNEVNGRDYHFLTEAEFDTRVAHGDFLEWAWVHRKHRYGTLKSAVLDRLAHISLVMNIDVQGVRSIRAAAASIPLLQRSLLTIFIAPDSFDVLRVRLEGRGPLPAEELARRLQSAELELADRHSYDYLIHSGSKDDDFQALLACLAKARQR